MFTASSSGLSRIARIVIACMVVVGAVASINRFKQNGTSLFNGRDLSGWQEVGGRPNEWSVENGLLHCRGSGGGWLGTRDEFANFEIELEFRLAPGGNSGVFLHSPLEGDPAYTGMEIQLLDDAAPEYANLRPEQYTGSIYDVVAAGARARISPSPLTGEGGVRVKSLAGQWQTIKILCDHRHVRVTLNGTVIVDANLDEHLDKLSKHPGLARTTGRIGLQNHTGPLDFRNLQIRVLP